MMCKTLPWQMCPSPINPELQEQLYDPAVFVQVALSLLQSWVSLVHSSMSELESTHRTYDHDYEYLSLMVKGEIGLHCVTIILLIITG